MYIRIFITGGTFDKQYNELSGELFFRTSQVEEILGLGRCKVDLQLTTIMMKDSLHMTDEDRQKIADHCTDADEDRILITHGTDTMTETAKAIATANLDKTIVLTGSMIPYDHRRSDSIFNLGCALGFVQSLPKGVYVVMNGKCFNWNNVRKNKEKGIFEEIKVNS